MQNRFTRKSAAVCAIVYALALTGSIVTRLLSQKLVPREGVTVIPNGNDCILSGDRVVVLAADRRLNDLSDILR